MTSPVPRLRWLSSSYLAVLEVLHRRRTASHGGRRDQCDSRPGASQGRRRCKNGAMGSKGAWPRPGGRDSCRRGSGLRGSGLRGSGLRGSGGSILSVGSSGSILSIGSAGSILSIGSAGSILSIGSVGSIASAFSAFSAASAGSVLSAGSRWSVSAWRASGKPPALTNHRQPARSSDWLPFSAR
jgi:hypothetical protein